VSVTAEIRRERGFTLLELLVVILIIGFVIAVSVPSLSRGTAAVELRTAGRDVVNCLRYAREKAITEQVGIQVAVDRESRKVLLLAEAGQGVRSYVLPESVHFGRLALTDGEGLDTLNLRFLPNGSSERAEIELRSRTGAQLWLVTDPITGGARILPGADRREP